MAEKKKETLSAEEVKLLKEKRELTRRMEEYEKTIAELQEKAKQNSEKISTANDDAIKELQAQIKLLSQQKGQDSGKSYADRTLQDYFRPVEPSDVLPDDQIVVYHARKISYTIASYVDKYGVERYPPHKIIVFDYAGHDIRKDGNEMSIRNYCTYKTALKSEQEYLDSHPLFGITFSSNSRDVSRMDVLNTEFIIAAHNQLDKLAPEEIIRRARDKNIEDPRKTAGELKTLLISKVAEELREQAKERDSEAVKRSILAKLQKEK